MEPNRFVSEWVTSTLPDGVTVAEVTRSDSVVAPAIWVASLGAVDIVPEALSFAFHQVDLERPYHRVKQEVLSIASLLRYFVWKNRPTLDQKAFRNFIFEYFQVRSKGNSDLSWRPLSKGSMETELRNLVLFSDFCELEFGYLPIICESGLRLPPRSNDQRSFWRLMAMNETDFFSHLAARRPKGEKSPILPGRRNHKGGGAGFRGMTEDLVREIILTENNRTYKAIWLLGFYGGPRLSEQLNLWVCDVLPGSWREHMFPGDAFTDLPLVTIANPWYSKWCGKIGELKSTRREFLAKNYGLNPRPMMAETSGGELRGKAAGFKGTRPTNNEGLMRQVLWTSIDAALEFEQEVIAVLETRRSLPKARLHPFLFVNTDRRKPEFLGDMITMSNITGAFERAVVRIGEKPYRFRQSPHGMRHFYADMARSLLDGEESSIQICLGHRSRSSQDAYGSLNMAAMRNAMALASKRPRST